MEDSNKDTSMSFRTAIDVYISIRVGNCRIYLRLEPIEVTGAKLPSGDVGGVIPQELQ
jgi:hypothetical protein